MSPEPPFRNPYASPRPESHSPEASPGGEPAPRSRLASLLLPAMIGGVGGCVLLAPYVRCPGDPFGHWIGAGLGMLAGLLLGLVLRVLAVNR